jgi:hypothetical protein
MTGDGVEKEAVKMVVLSSQTDATAAAPTAAAAAASSPESQQRIAREGRQYRRWPHCRLIEV